MANGDQKEPSDADLQRYHYYVEHATNKYMIAKQPDNQFDLFCKFIPEELRESKFMRLLEKELSNDIEQDYKYSMKKAIVDYVLLNREERARVKIEALPRPFIIK